MTTLQLQPINVSKYATEKENAVLLDYFAKNPVTLAEFPTLFAPVLADDSKVTIGELIDSPINDLSEQNDIDDKRVLSYIISSTATNYPFIKVRRFIRPIEVGVLNDGRICILGGRHRTVQYLTVALLSGIDINSEDFRSIEVPVFKTIYSAEYIVCSNKSRAVTKPEVVTISAASKGIDITDSGALLTALTEKTLSATDVFCLLALNALDESEKLPTLVSELTRATYGQIFSSAASIIGRNKAYRASLKDETWVAKCFGVLVDAKLVNVQDEDGESRQAVTYSFSKLDKAVNQVKREGVTNLARSSAKIATYLVDSIKLPKPAAVTVKSAKVAEVVEAAAKRKGEVEEASEA